MFKTKAANGSNSRQKKLPPRPKPQFTTDFVDRQQYKLSEAERIQKKASLQSKHREEAIQQLQERRRKLEQGIIDDDTRKVYETALTSKKIDVNPPIRKNLSEMIKYEREKQEQVRSSSRERQRPRPQWEVENRVGAQEQEEQDENEDVERQLRETRDFIKKFQRVKKMDNIGRAVEILAQPSSQTVKRNPARSRQKSKERSPKANPLCNQKLVLDMKESKTSAMSSQQEALSSIEDTIRFMEERLFSAKRIEKIKQEEFDKLKESTISCQDNYQPFTVGIQGTKKENLDLSGLGYHESDAEDQCLQTIRRMKEMMDGQSSPLKLKENLQIVGNKQSRFEGFSTLPKVSPHIADSEDEVDFSLTMNESEPSSLRQQKIEAEADERQYQRIKKSLFEQVNRLQLQTPQISVMEPSFQARGNIPIDQSSITNVRTIPTPPPSKQKKISSEIMKLKSQIDGVKGSVDAIKIEAVPIMRPSEVMGVDFRGSINIKKHIIPK